MQGNELQGTQRQLSMGSPGARDHGRRRVFERPVMVLVCGVLTCAALVAAGPTVGGRSSPVDVTAIYTGEVRLEEGEGTPPELQLQNEFGLRLHLKDGQGNSLVLASDIRLLNPRSPVVYGALLASLKVYPFKGVAATADAGTRTGFDPDDPLGDFQERHSGLDLSWGSSQKGLSGKLTLDNKDVDFLDKPWKSYHEETQELSVRGSPSKPLRLKLTAGRVDKLYKVEPDHSSSRIGWRTDFTYVPVPTLELGAYASDVLKDYPVKPQLCYQQKLLGVSFEWEPAPFATVIASSASSDKRFPWASGKDQLRTTHSVRLGLVLTRNLEAELKWSRSDCNYPQNPAKDSSRVSGGARVRFRASRDVELEASGEIADKESEDMEPWEYERSLSAAISLTWDAREDTRVSLSWRSRKEPSEDGNLWKNVSSGYELRVVRKFG